MHFLFNHCKFMEEEYLNFSPLSLEIDFDDDDGINFINLFQMKIFLVIIIIFQYKTTMGFWCQLQNGYIQLNLIKKWW